MKRSEIGVHTVFDSVFHNRLQGERWQSKIHKRCVIINNQQIVILCLFYGEISAGVLQFRR